MDEPEFVVQSFASPRKGGLWLMCRFSMESGRYPIIGVGEEVELITVEGERIRVTVAGYHTVFTDPWDGEHLTFGMFVPLSAEEKPRLRGAKVKPIVKANG